MAHTGSLRRRERLNDGLLAAVFIYWGWDTAASVNEECEGANTTPGLASVLSTFILVAIFVVFAFAAQAVRGADFLSKNSDDVLKATGHIVFGTSGFGTFALKLLIVAVLTSSAASCQTTILPAARTALSMAIHRAFPPKLGEVDSRHLTPAFSTWLFGIGSSLWLTLLVLVSRYSGGDVLAWSVDGVGLMIAYYYGQTGIACVFYYRKHIFTSLKNFLFVGLLPLLGGVSLAFIFVWGIKDYASASYEGASWFGIGPVVWLGLGTLLAGIPLMYLVELERPRVLPDQDGPDRFAPAARRWATAPAARSRRSSALMAGEVVLGYDGEPGSKAALQTAVAIAAAFKRPLVIAFGYAPAPIGGDVADLSKAIEDLGEKITGEATKIAHDLDASVATQVELVNDRPAEAILRAAEQYEALAIVVGAAGRGPMAGALLGSVTYQVVHRSTRPVVVVPSPEIA